MTYFSVTGLTAAHSCPDRIFRRLEGTENEKYIWRYNVDEMMDLMLIFAAYIIEKAENRT